MILPFPYGLAAALAIFIAFPLFLRRRYMGRMKGYGDSGMGGGWMGAQSNEVSLKFECLRCGKQYKGKECPVCGSRQTRPRF